MIDRVLILACDRPDYLIQVLDSVREENIFVLLDRPLKNIELHNQCKEVLKKAGVKYDVNEKNLGCSQAMFKLLSKVEKDEVVMVLEDDTVLLPNYQEAFDSIPSGDFVLKLGGFFWGWVANYGAIRKVLALKEGDFESKKHEKDPVYKAITDFKEAGVEVLWDAFFQSAIKFCGIKEVRFKKSFTKNIGVIASRQAPKIGAYATYVNGEFKGVTKI